MTATTSGAPDPHDGIPKDETGTPVFFVLPDGVRASYQRKLARCEAGWRATRDPAFISEAQILTHLHRQPSTLWLSEAIIELAAKRRTKGYATRAYLAAIRQTRFEAVQEARRSGLSWPAAYARASKLLAPTGAAGKASTMKRANDDMSRDRRNGRGAHYLTPLMPHQKLGDALRRKPSPR